jgi:hypothetical protein
MAAFFMPVIVSLLIVFLLMPKPALPLTDNQIAIYQDGKFLNNFWDKLSKKEQKHLKDLSTEADNATSDGSNSADNS